MEHRHTFVFIAVVIVLLCLVCQIHAIRLLMTRPQENPLSESTELSVQSIATEQEATPKKHTDETSHHSRKLKKLYALEDFMAYSASELQMGEAIRKNDLPFDSWLTVDTTKANWREKKDKLLENRRKWLADAMEKLEKYLEEEDFSSLSQEEYTKLLEYRDALRQWAEIAYDDNVDLETKIAACKRWSNYNSYHNNHAMYEIASKQFNAVYGDIYKQYETLYNRSGLEEIISLTNPNLINRTSVSVRDADGKQHHYRVKLFNN